MPGLFLAELRRHLRLKWSYRLNSVSWIVLWVVAFPLLVTTFDNVAGGYRVERRQASLTGFLMWDWSMTLLTVTVGFVSAEAREGTLESLVLSPVPPIMLFGLRTFAAMLVQGGQTLVLGGMNEGSWPRRAEPDRFMSRLMKAGMKMAALVPSTMGTLMASGVMGGGKALTGRDLIDAAGYRDYLVGFAEGIARRGKCSRGDRTVLDAIGRAADKLAAAIAERPGLSLAEAAEIALLGAREGVEATRAMEPKFGKAAVHRLAAVGQADQGACAGMYMIAGYRDFLVR